MGRSDGVKDERWGMGRRELSHTAHNNPQLVTYLLTGCLATSGLTGGLLGTSHGIRRVRRIEVGDWVLTVQSERKTQQLSKSTKPT